MGEQRGGRGGLCGSKGPHRPLACKGFVHQTAFPSESPSKGREMAPRSHPTPAKPSTSWPAVRSNFLSGRTLSSGLEAQSPPLELQGMEQCGHQSGQLCGPPKSSASPGPDAKHCPAPDSPVVDSVPSSVHWPFHRGRGSGHPNSPSPGPRVRRPPVARPVASAPPAELWPGLRDCLPAAAREPRSASFLPLSWLQAGPQPSPGQAARQRRRLG